MESTEYFLVETFLREHVKRPLSGTVEVHDECTACEHTKAARTINKWVHIFERSCKTLVCTANSCIALVNLDNQFRQGR